MFYILNDEENPIKVDDVVVWAKWFETAHGKRIIAQDSVGDVFVSTVFLGLDHNFGFGGDPLLYQTMIFGGPHDQYQSRYASRQGAIAGHAQALAMVVKIGSTVVSSDIGPETKERS